MMGKQDPQAAGAESSTEAGLTRRIAQLERENHHLRERCEQAELENVELERALQRVENTLSFRLGHALIQSTKSLDGLKALPLLLAELRSDSLRLKRRGGRPKGLVAATLRTSVSYAERWIKGQGER